MPRHDRSDGVYHQPGRKAGSVARKTRTKKGGRYAEKMGIQSTRKAKRR